MILEALSATGLRSVRYAKEIPLVKSDLSYERKQTVRLTRLLQIRDCKRLVTHSRSGYAT